MAEPFYRMTSIIAISSIYFGRKQIFRNAGPRKILPLVERLSVYKFVRSAMYHQNISFSDLDHYWNMTPAHTVFQGVWISIYLIHFKTNLSSWMSSSLSSSSLSFFLEASIWRVSSSSNSIFS